MAYKTLTICSLMLPVLFILMPLPVAAQHGKHKKKAKTGYEIGLDALPYLSQIGDDIPGLRKDWELFFKSRMERGGFRVKFAHHHKPIHKKRQFKVIEVTDECVDGVAFKSTQKPQDFFFLNFGYESRLTTKWFDLIYGADLNLSRYMGVTIVNKADCLIVIDDIRVIDEVQWMIIPKSNYGGIGVTPFVGIKLPVLKHLRLTIETGLQFNRLIGDYTYMKADRDSGFLKLDKGYHKPKDFEVNWGNLTNDIGISYAF